MGLPAWCRLKKELKFSHKKPWSENKELSGGGCNSSRFNILGEVLLGNLPSASHQSLSTLLCVPTYKTLLIDNHMWTFPLWVLFFPFLIWFNQTFFFIRILPPTFPRLNSLTRTSIPSHGSPAPWLGHQLDRLKYTNTTNSNTLYILFYKVNVVHIFIHCCV